MSELLSVPAHLELDQRIRWLLRLRWWAILCALVAVGVGNAVLPGVLPVPALLITAAATALYNLLISLYVRHLERQPVGTFRAFQVIAHLQELLDILALICLLHFSGGLENPFLFFLVLPVLNANLVFDRRTGWGYAVLVALAAWGLLLLEATGTVPHYNLRGYRLETRHTEPLHILSVGIALNLLLIFVSHFISSIIGRLRQRTQELWEANLACETRADELARLNQELAAANLACELRTQQLSELNEQLAQANLSCETRAGELARANAQLAEMNKKLKELDDARMEFTLLVTHELRAPVAAIHSYIKLILDGYVPPERQREILERSEQRAREQLDLIADLLELGKIQKRVLVGESKPIQVEQVLQTVCETVQSWADEKGITLHVEIEPDLPPVMAAPNHIKQLWMNLISNGIKYTPRGGEVTAAVRREDDVIVGMVRDTGIGIAPKDQERIFQDFFRTDEAKAMERQGTGLGLSIVKRIVEIYGGSIELESAVGVGSTFTFRLPLHSSVQSA